MSEGKLKDARLLLENNRCSSAYYLAGYAVEFGLKAAACKIFLKECMPDKNFVNAIYTHKLNELLQLSGLKGRYDAAAAEDRLLKANWATVSRWDEASRYAFIDEFRAVEMVNAVAEETSGVLPWLKRHW
jgi:HEPN domain-containing protein